MLLFGILYDILNDLMFFWLIFVVVRSFLGFILIWFIFIFLGGNEIEIIIGFFGDVFLIVRGLLMFFGWILLILVGEILLLVNEMFLVGIWE